MGTTSVSSYCRSISSRHEAHKVWFNNPASFRYYHSSIRRGFDRYHPAAWRCLDFGPCRLCLQTGSSRPVLSIERTRGTDPSDFPAALTHQRSVIHPVESSRQGKSSVLQSKCQVCYVNVHWQALCRMESKYCRSCSWVL